MIAAFVESLAKNFNNVEDYRNLAILFPETLKNTTFQKSFLKEGKFTSKQKYDLIGPVRGETFAEGSFFLNIPFGKFIVERVNNDYSMLVVNGILADKRKRGIWRYWKNFIIDQDYDVNYEIIPNVRKNYHGKILTGEGQINLQGERDGLWRFYWVDGKLLAEGIYFNGTEDDNWSFYSRDGKMVSDFALSKTFELTLNIFKDQNEELLQRLNK